MQKFEKLGYRFVGPSKHSAVKICTWTKHSLRDKKRIGGKENFCYKQKFYGISSHRCVQMTPSLFCTERCEFCWRPSDVKAPKWVGKADEPSEILDECIKYQANLLQGFRSIVKDKIKMHEAEHPKHFAISLDGEPLMYPKINAMIEEIARRRMTSFIVTNGTLSGVVEDLTEPTQLYITLPASNEEIYEKTCRPLVGDAWAKINRSLMMLSSFSCNTVVRLTLVRKLNMAHPEQYAKIIDRTNPKFVEVKSFMSVGAARERLSYERMPLHDEIKEFAEKISSESGYKVRDEKRDSRVVLLTR